MTTPKTSLPTRQALMRAFGEAPELRRRLVGTVLLALAGTALQIVTPIMVQQIIDGEILASDGIDVGRVMARGAVAVVAMALGVLAGRAALIRLAEQSAAGLSQLRVRTFGHLHRLSVLHVEAERRGSLVSRVTSDIHTIQDFMDWGGVGLLLGSAQVLLVIIVMLVYDWRLALLVIGGVLVYALLMAWIQRILARAHDRVRERVADTLAATGEAISGLPVVRAYGAEDEAVGRVRDRLAAQWRAQFRANRLGAYLFSSAEVFAGAITAAVLAVGVWLGSTSGTSAGTLLAFLFLVNLLVDPVQMLVEILDHAQTAGAGLRRVLGVLDTPVLLTDPAPGTDLPAGDTGVRFEGVGYTYPSGTQALAHVDVHIRAGSRVAVVGETGSGKTTFAKLVTRLLDPTEGTVSVGGIPLDEVPFDQLRSRLSFVPQEGFLFDASIADNVRYGRPSATDAEVRQAFVDLDLRDWVAQLTDGIDTRVGERGGQLSAGERQLVALVRAWIADPALLVLDEATSAVDPALEVKIRRAIEALTAGRTSITIAHRLSTAEAADEVLVFDGGRLAERGAHAELLARGGVYAALHADWMAGTQM